MNLAQYRTLVFDCDGVVLDSNRVKTEAFYTAALPYGESHAQALVTYHTQHGGISRYAKFEKFLRDIVGGPVDDVATRELLESYAAEVRQGLLQCRIAEGLELLRKATPHARWMLLSGGDQAELRDVFSQRGIASWFDLGIYGSPESKDDILSREIANGALELPTLFFGDSRYDHQAATRAGLDFVFVSGWTEFEGWQDYCREHGIPVIFSIGSLNGQPSD